MAYNGTALAAVAIGTVFVYGGIKGKSPLAVLLSVVKGSSPTGVPSSQAITAADYADAQDVLAAGQPAQSESEMSASAHGGGSQANAQQALSNAAARYGWNTGAEWQALNNIESREAGYNPLATNPSSKAFGLAQALDHGQGAATQGTLSNMYGGYGLSNTQAQAANSGDPTAQALWMVNYIKDRYGTPSAAWAQYCAHGDGKCWY